MTRDSWRILTERSKRKKERRKEEGDGACTRYKRIKKEVPELELY